MYIFCETFFPVTRGDRRRKVRASADLRIKDTSREEKTGRREKEGAKIEMEKAK